MSDASLPRVRMETAVPQPYSPARAYVVSCAFALKSLHGAGWRELVPSSHCFASLSHCRWAQGRIERSSKNSRKQKHVKEALGVGERLKCQSGHRRVEARLGVRQLYRPVDGRRKHYPNSARVHISPKSEVTSLHHFGISHHVHDLPAGF